MSGLDFWFIQAVWLLGSLWATRVAYLAGKREGRALQHWIDSLKGADK